jgi:methylphosphotriester-DNA--protein-cysteine methyltransferase
MLGGDANQHCVDCIRFENETESDTSGVLPNITSNVYHLADCPKLGNNIMKFDSPEQAREASGVPCKDCNP